LRDFPFWRGAIYNAKTRRELNDVAEELEKFEKWSKLNGSDDEKLTDAQLDSLYLQYTEKMKRLDKEP
jgi:hypothetical protein